MLTHFKGLYAGGQRNSHNSFRTHRHPHHNQLLLSHHSPSREASAVDLSGGSGAEGKRHSPPQSAPAEATAQCFAYCFFGGPQVKEGLDLIRLVVHPGELSGVEPPVGEAGDGKGPPLLEVDPERAVETGGNHHQVVSVADAHGQRIDVRLTEVVVPQYRLFLQKRAGQRQQEFVGRRARISAGGCQPDVRGFQIGAWTLNHRKKVSR